MSFYTQGFPGVPESTVSKKRKISFSLGRSFPSGRMRGAGNCSSPASPTVCDGPPSPGERGVSLGCGFCDFAFNSAQNDRVGGILRREKVFRSMAQISIMFSERFFVSVGNVLKECVSETHSKFEFQGDIFHLTFVSFMGHQTFTAQKPLNLERVENENTQSNISPFCYVNQYNIICWWSL